VVRWLAASILLCLNLSAAPMAAAQGQPATSAEEYVQRLSKNVRTVWPRTDAIWPGVDFSEMVLIFTDSRRGWAISTDATRELSTEELASAPKPVRNDLVNYELFEDWRGHPGLTFAVRPDYFSSTAYWLELKYSSTAAFEIASHELFHMQVQQGWSVGPGASPPLRGTRYPLDTEPRVMRLELYEALVRAYANPDERPQHLGAAAYWFNRWLDTGEANEGRLTDLAEGTAEYFDSVAGARAALGFDVPPDSYKGILLRQLHDRSGHWSARLDSESYPIGLAAGLIAEQELLDWQAAAERGIAPVTFLLQNVTPTQQVAADKTRALIEPEIGRIAERVAPKLDPLIEALGNAEQPVLVLPLTGMVGTFSPGDGFFFSAATGYAQLIPNLTARFDGAAGSAALNERAVAFSEAPCPFEAPWPFDIAETTQAPMAGFAVVPVSLEEIGNATSEVTILGDSLTATLHVDKVEDGTGRLILCATPR
jgi:hypothetical protein